MYRASSESMFIPIKFKTSVQLSPVELRDDFDAVVMSKLRRNLEGVCSRYGYIKAGSLDIVKRSAGKLMKQHFNGFIQFTVLCKGEVCNPAEDSIIKAKVVNKNALGILAESYIEGSSEPVLDIIVPKKTAGVVSEIDVEDLSIGDEIFVRVIGKRFQLNDKKIAIIGRVVADKEKSGIPADDNGADEDGEEVVDGGGGDEAEEDEEDDGDDDEGDEEVVDGGDEAEHEGNDDLLHEYDDFDKEMTLVEEEDDDTSEQSNPSDGGSESDDVPYYEA